jgi:hypothetical protein
VEISTREGKLDLAAAIDLTLARCWPCHTTEYPNAALTLRCDQDRRRKLSYRLRDTTRGHRPD